MEQHIITIFRNRVRKGTDGEYLKVAGEMASLAEAMPGFLDSKTFEAPDGEQVTVVTFADRAGHEAWRDHPEHRAAQRAGIEHFYDEYSIQVGILTYEHHFSH